jgi:predicted lipoprotein with Yx(FWY)xxD motif
MLKTRLAVAGIGLLLASGVAFAQEAKVIKTPAGHVLATPAGKTLYVYDNDKPGTGTTTCTKQCAKHWPPFLASRNAHAKGKWSFIVRPDGKRQWAYKDRPLYTWSRDTKAGEISGDGYDGNRWHIAKP